VLAVLQGHIDQFNLRPIVNEAQQCVETASVKTGGTCAKVTAVFTPRWLA
jgi:hypothetical protein